MVFVQFVTWSPLVSIIVFSLIITTGLSFLYKKLINKEEFERLKEKQKELREKAKEYKNNPEKLTGLQKEMIEDSMASMKLTLKPMMVSFIPLILVFYGLKKLYMDMVGVGNIISWTRNLPIIHDGAGWLLCYIVFSLIFSMILRKAFKIY